ncbi:hypothetical protein [Planctomyces sp. SH-PL62]|uniref:hypothetical protein n=1 Tax=Planctomyces sp. SH-PL62 TaxID=1636152 RepID=UPI00078C2A59|nr:hypothetical protein [Planctomyces sp. SH-PL62]AMV36218.1 hypothetical protein VT85_02160 [Planctomyces sp. SH-PL62]
MSSSPGSLHGRHPRGVALRLSGAACAAAAFLIAASGCEYFTSDRLAKLTPGQAADPASRLGPDPLGPSAAGKEPVTIDPATGEPTSLTAAEIVAMLDRINRGNQRELDELTTRVGQTEELEHARDVFQHLDDLLKSLERERKKALAEGQAQRAEELARQAEGLKEPWTLARERLNLDLRARTLILERLDILQEILGHDRQRLSAMLVSGDLGRFLDDAPSPAAADSEQAGAAAEPSPPAASDATPTPAPARPRPRPRRRSRSRSSRESP